MHRNKQTKILFNRVQYSVWVGIFQISTRAKWHFVFDNLKPKDKITSEKSDQLSKEHKNWRIESGPYLSLKHNCLEHTQLNICKM